MESRCHGRGLDTEGEGDSEGEGARGRRRRERKVCTVHRKGKSVQEDSVLAETSQVPSVEKVMQFDVVRRVGTEMSGIPLDPADVERECENLSDDEEGVEVETENSVVVID
jgi:hypothetical protein